nr:MAG TPA: hypothetical protein [Caudoviricetes sp.]
MTFLSSPFPLWPDGSCSRLAVFMPHSRPFGRGAVSPSNGTARVQGPCAAPLPGTRQRLTHFTLFPFVRACRGS